jgi:biotin carboxyl carrier protein
MPDDPSRSDIGRLTGEIIPALIARLGASSLGELEVRRDGWRVRIRRNGSAPEPEPAAGSRARHPARSGEGRERPPKQAEAQGMRAVGPGPERVRERRARLATSPAVGYYVPDPELATGRQVREGDVLGHVDVLGVRQEIVAPTSGIVSRLLAQPGEAVEYGQELIQLEPTSRPAPEGG